MSYDNKIDDNQQECLVFVCVDGSQNATRAFEWYHKHCYRKDHVVGIVYISSRLEKPLTKNNEIINVKDENLKNDGTAIIQRFLCLCFQYGMKARIYTARQKDSIGHTICDLVKESNPDSIVIGQRGVGLVKRTLYGSVSEHILHHAHKPVLIVPPGKKGEC